MAICPLQQPSSISTAVNDRYNETLHPVREDVHHASHCVAGYEDGTVRLFDFSKVEMIMKMQPHSVAVTALCCSNDGEIFISYRKNL